MVREEDIIAFPWKNIGVSDTSIVLGIYIT
jgi:hypothetical protein